MPDLERVVAEIESDPNVLNTNCGLTLVSVSLLREVLALLEEQEPVKRTSRTGANGYSLVWTCGNCGSDLHPNNAKAKYCSNCGKAVKWKDD